jgi:hypothetical protein
MGRRTVVLALVTLLAAAAVGSAVAAAPRTPGQVARAWSAALDAGDDRAAAALFAANAVAVQGPYLYRLRTAKLATLWNSRLPCAGRILRVSVRGRVATVTFVLGHRPGHVCDGPGQLAAAKFTVVNGKIVRWEQVPPPNSAPAA